MPQLIRGNDQGGKTVLLKTLYESTRITFFFKSPHAHNVQDPTTTIGALNRFWFVPNFYQTPHQLPGVLGEPKSADLNRIVGVSRRATCIIRELCFNRPRR